ncbi:MAG: hypothetical protein KatS3mg131_1320 [Candidatus Tectimicrobiota bacterium]|nr:MAG: hypothetical protein KatS3mg131_1320 [Candidatus Tectomicrobia bacterium]
MNVYPLDPPRLFRVGFETPVLLKDCARLALAPDEQVTFITESGKEYDVVRKDWGFYATPSLNGRLLQFGLHAALVANRQGRFYLVLVEREQEAAFWRYLAQERLQLVSWLDSTAALARLARRLWEAR